MDDLLTVKETAAFLKVSRVQVRKMIQNGELAAVMIGREYRIPIGILRAFVENNLSWGV